MGKATRRPRPMAAMTATTLDTSKLPSASLLAPHRAAKSYLYCPMMVAAMPRTK